MKASIILPLYNASTYISETIESILPQLDNDIELLIVDDGSTDGSSELAMNYVSTHVHYIRISNSGGPARPRNVGIANAKGEIIFLFDSDDTMLPGKISDTLDVFSLYPHVAMVFTDFESMDDKGQTLNSDYLSSYTLVKENRGFLRYPARIDKRDAYFNLAFENYIGTSGVAIKKSVIDQLGHFDEQLTNSDDRDMWFRITRQYDIAYLPRVLHRYRIHSGSISHRPNASRVTSKVMVLKRQLDYCPNNIFRNQLRKLCSDNYFSLAWEHKKSGDLTLALRYLFISSRYKFNFIQIKLLIRLISLIVFYRSQNA